MGRTTTWRARTRSAGTQNHPREGPPDPRRDGHSEELLLFGIPAQFLELRLTGDVVAAWVPPGRSTRRGARVGRATWR